MAFTGNAATISSHAALRLLSHSVDQTAFVMGANAAPDGGGATYAYVPSDTTSGCLFSGSVSGTTLTVTSVTNGSLIIGLSVNRSDTGASIGTIISLGMMAGTYNLSAPATISGPFTFTADNDSSFIVAVDGGRWFNVGYFPQTAAEIAAGITPTNLTYPPGNVLRYGIVPNSSSAATTNTNTMNLKALLNQNKVGPTGTITFPNTTGSDTYYFNSVIPVRDGIHIDLQECTLSYTGAVGAGDVNSGLFLVLRDFICENGSITVAVDTTNATGSGRAIYVGARGTDSSYFTVFDASLTVPLGNITLRNLRLTIANTGTNAAAGAAIGSTGGLVNVVMENIVIDGSNTTPIGIEYEYGWATSPPSTATTQTSHGHNLVYRNIKVFRLKNSGITDGGGILLTGAYNATVDGLYVNTCYDGFEFRPGEALFFNPWVGTDDVGAKRNITLRNIVVEGCTNLGLSLQGAESASGGYLSGAGLTSAQQSDLMTFSVDGAAISGTGVALSLSGPLVCRNGYFACVNTSGNVVIFDECISANFINCRVVGQTGGGVGIRADIGSTLGAAAWSPQRQKFIAVTDSLIAGNTGPGISLGNTQGATIARNRLGYNAHYDGAGNETLQTSGVSIGMTASGVMLDSNFVTTSGGAAAYSLIGTGPRTCNIRNALGTVTTSGTFDFNDVSLASAAQIGSISSGVNTAGKFIGKLCMDTTNSRLYIATGATAASKWELADGSASVTPSPP